MKHRLQALKLCLDSSVVVVIQIREAVPLGEFKEILSGISMLAEDDRRLMALMLLTGMRRGVILGLRWEDIRLDEELIYIQRNVTYAGNQPYVGTPKTSSGERMIPINDMLAEYLQPFQREGFILGGEKPITEMSYKRRMYRIGKQVNLHNATAHVFRHSYLTYAAGTGTDVKTLQAIAGHADIQMTMNRYVHKQTSHIIDADSRMQALLSTKFDVVCARNVHGERTLKPLFCKGLNPILTPSMIRFCA